MLDNAEITNILYDTLMENKQWPQLQLCELFEQEIVSGDGKIRFEYLGLSVELTVTSKPLD